MKLILKYAFNAITKQQARFYQDNGYLIVPNAVSDAQIDALLKQTDKLVEDADILANAMYFQNTDRGINFLDTASTIGYLLEPGIVKDGKLTVPKKQALNKIGHAMHDLDPVYEKFSYNKNFAQVLQALNVLDPVLVQSMLIFKNQKVGTPVNMHTDNTYIISEPRLSCIGMWIALQDATRQNGCMYAFPGSHKIPTTYFSKLDDTRRQTIYEGPEPKYESIYNEKDAACLEVKKGTLICLHGDLVHYSGHNTSNVPRHAYTMHFYDAYQNKWSDKAWLQRTKDLPFRKYNQVVKSQ